MSKYLLDKFLYTVDRDPALVERYRTDPAGTVEWWEREMANSLLNCAAEERSTSSRCSSGTTGRWSTSSPMPGPWSTSRCPTPISRPNGSPPGPRRPGWT